MSLYIPYKIHFAAPSAVDPYGIFMERALQPSRFFMCRRSKIGRIDQPLSPKEEAMPDASMVILMVASFALMIGYARLCERL